MPRRKADIRGLSVYGCGRVEMGSFFGAEVAGLSMVSGLKMGSFGVFRLCMAVLLLFASGFALF